MRYRPSPRSDRRWGRAEVVAVRIPRRVGSSGFRPCRVRRLGRRLDRHRPQHGIDRVDPQRRGAFQAAAEMFAEEINAEGGVTVGDEQRTLEFVIEDNSGTAEGAGAAAESLIADDILVMVGPNASVAAVPAGAVANEQEVPMISPWSTNPSTTLGRPWVFRVPYIDLFQGPILAEFAAEEFGAERACVLFAADSDAPRGVAESFRVAWEANNGPGLGGGLRVVHHRHRDVHGAARGHHRSRLRRALHAAVLQRGPAHRAPGAVSRAGRPDRRQRRLERPAADRALRHRLRRHVLRRALRARRRDGRDEGVHRRVRGARRRDPERRGSADLGCDADRRAGDRELRRADRRHPRRSGVRPRRHGGHPRVRGDHGQRCRSATRAIRPSAW